MLPPVVAPELVVGSLALELKGVVAGNGFPSVGGLGLGGLQALGQPFDEAVEQGHGSISRLKPKLRHMRAMVAEMWKRCRRGLDDCAG